MKLPFELLLLPLVVGLAIGTAASTDGRPVVAFVAGVVLLFLAALWRVLARNRRQRHARELLHEALGDPDPIARLAAVQVAAQQGIAPVAEELLEATRTEQDAAVLEGITEAVARHQWEPTLEPELLELRLWAQRRLVEIRQKEREELSRRPAPTEDEIALPPLAAPTNGVVHEPVAQPATMTDIVFRWLGERARARKRS